jgi:hypothetical protein
MARISHTSEKSNSSNNPTKRYLDWKSNNKSFEYYDKEAGEKVSVELPLKFVFLQHYHTVKGWHDASQSGIYSNEVFYIGSEEMNVKSFKGGSIASGLYKDIKVDLMNAGAKYHRSVYVMLEDGTIANVSMKGAVVKEWSDFIDVNKSLVDTKWVEVSSTKDQKKGSIKYSTPEFKLGGDLNPNDIKNADRSAEMLKEYLDAYFGKVEEELEIGI